MSGALIQNLDALRQRLAPHLRHARKAIVFGSVARGERPFTRCGGVSIS
jgi:predicted nucleotidyltransferase